MQEQPVLFERDGPVAIVTLNRPEKHNAMNRALNSALGRIFEEIGEDDSINAVVLTGAGDKAFCAGADMSQRGEPETEPPVATSSARVDGIAAVYQATKPVIAAINGYAYGGGARLAVSTDIRLASTTAKIRFVSVSYGLVACGTELPPIVGTAMAKELIYTARVVEADEAERIGLVNHVYPPEQLMPAAIEMAKQIAANSPQAVQWAKKVIDAASTIERGLEVEIEARQASSRSEDHDTRFREAAARVTGRGA